MTTQLTEKPKEQGIVPLGVKHEVEQPVKDEYRPISRLLATLDAFNRIAVSGPRNGVVQLISSPKQKIVDVGCGTGRLARQLTKAGHEVVGIDSSPGILDRAIEKGQAEYQLLDATDMAFANEFDVAVISLTLHTMPSDIREQVWQKIHKAVRKGGMLIALDFSIPPQKTPYSRFIRRVIDMDESYYRKSVWSHYQNYLQFMQRGGLLGWIRHTGDEILAKRYYLGGNIGVIGVPAR